MNGHAAFSHLAMCRSISPCSPLGKLHAVEAWVSPCLDENVTQPSCWPRSNEAFMGLLLCSLVSRCNDVHWDLSRPGDKQAPAAFAGGGSPQPSPHWNRLGFTHEREQEITRCRCHLRRLEDEIRHRLSSGPATISDRKRGSPMLSPCGMPISDATKQDDISATNSHIA